jgi:hypothetical protein
MRVREAIDLLVGGAARRVAGHGRRGTGAGKRPVVERLAGCWGFLGVRAVACVWPGPPPRPSPRGKGEENIATFSCFSLLLVGRTGVGGSAPNSHHRVRPWFRHDTVTRPPR